MSFSVALMRQLDTVDPALRAVLWTILEEIEQHRESSVTKTEFLALNELVAKQTTLLDKTNETLDRLGQQIDHRLDRVGQKIEELAEAQNRTEQKVEQLAEAQNQLTAAQNRTEQKVEQLAEAQNQLTAAQQRTEKQVERSEKQIEHLARQMESLQKHVGGLSKSVAYALENEAYRKLPAYLRGNYGISVEKRLIRMTLGEREINLFAHARKDNQEILIVGESVLRLDDAAKLSQLRAHVEMVRLVHALPVIPLIITHFAKPKVLALAEAEGILVVQSFQWDEND